MLNNTCPISPWFNTSFTAILIVAMPTSPIKSIEGTSTVTPAPTKFSP